LHVKKIDHTVWSKKLTWLDLMGMIQTRVLRKLWDVDRRLIELGLDRERLLNIRSIAVSAGADATPFHPANAAGTLAYHHGTWALRDQFVGDAWVLERPNGVEAIRNESAGVRVVFANVDLACNDDQPPKPRSEKGAGAERACMGNLFGQLPHFTPQPVPGCATYYLMVDENGAAELTCPVVKDGTFTAYVERIYLSDGTDLDKATLSLDDGDIADGFDPQVVRK
jgi:hypothetical protein